jgi:hypothetical protein
MEDKFTKAKQKVDNQVNKLNQISAEVKDPKISADIQNTIQNAMTTDKAAHEASIAI